MRMKEGRGYRICGMVEEGKRLGRTIGFPTANIRAALAEDMPRGVYAAWLRADGQRYGCMVNIGSHPTAPEGKPTIEAHIFGFSGSLYGHMVELEIAGYLRAEVRFPSLDALKKQLAQDALQAQQMLHDTNPLGIE